MHLFKFALIMSILIDLTIFGLIKQIVTQFIIVVYLITIHLA